MMKFTSLARASVPLVCATLAFGALVPTTLAQTAQKSDRLKQETMTALQAETDRIARDKAEAASSKAAGTAEVEARAARIRAALAAPELPAGGAGRSANAALPATTAALAAPAGATLNTAAAPVPALLADGSPAPAAPAGAALAVVAAAPETAPMSSEQRIALVIGNSNYKSSPLTNPTNDARAMAIKLQQLGFTVIKRENASMEEMMTSVREFGNQLKNGGIGLFYYAGHGVQSKGINYLVPVDANISNEDELATRAYNANEVLEKMDSAKNRINLVILDACRDNPFARSFRSGARGLAGMETAPRGTMVAYATSPGSTASDGSGANGLYTEQLLNAMADPGVKVEDVFKRVREGVQERSGGKQTPWEMSSITGNFYFNPTPEQAAMPVMMAGTGQRLAGMPRQLMPVLIPRKLIENYQLAGNFHLAAGTTVGSFSSTGQHIALATRDHALNVWNTGTGMAVASEPAYGDASLTANRRYLLGVDGNQVRITDLQQEAAPRVVSGLPKGIKVAALSPDGQRLLIYTRDLGFVLYDSVSAKQLAQLDDIDGDPRFEFAPGGNRLLTWGTRETNMKLWDTDQGKKISRLSDHWNPIGYAHFSRDGSYMVSAAFDDKAVVWRSSDGESLRRFTFGETNPLPLSGEFFNDGKRLLAYVPRGAKPPLVGTLQLGVWDVAGGNQLASLLPDGITVRNYRFSPDRMRLFVDASDRSLQVFDMNTLKRISNLAGAELLEFSPDGRRVIIKGGEGVRLLDTQTLSPLARMPGQVSAHVAQKGNLFVTCSPDGVLTLWNIDNGDPAGQLKGHLDAVTMALFSDDGRRLISVGTDNVAKLWALPEIKDMNRLTKDQFESSVEYQKRMGSWSSPYASLVTLAGYNADAETFTVKVGDVSVEVPFEREAAKKLVGQRQAIVSGNLHFFDNEQLVLAEPKLSRLP